MYEDSIQQTSIMCEKCRHGNDDITLVKEMATLMDSLLAKWVICVEACRAWFTTPLLHIYYTFTTPFIRTWEIFWVLASIQLKVRRDYA